MTGYEGTLDRAQILAGFIEASRSGLRLTDCVAHPDGDLINGTTTLSDVMEFDHVIYSDGRGHIKDVIGLWAPEAHQYEDEHGDWETHFEAGENGWSLMRNYSSQQGGSPDGWMHESEFIGGGMARDILATPGFYVAIYPYTEGNDGEQQEADTWAVAYISENIPGSITK